MMAEVMNDCVLMRRAGWRRRTLKLKCLAGCTWLAMVVMARNGAGWACRRRVAGVGSEGGEGGLLDYVGRATSPVTAW